MTVSGIFALIGLCLFFLAVGTYFTASTHPAPSQTDLGEKFVLFGGGCIVCWLIAVVDFFIG